MIITAARSEEYNQKFWDKLQDEWKKISEDNDAEHPWLSEFTDYYDPYKVIYQFFLCF